MSIDLEFQMTDFDENELVKYVEFAEALYEKHRKHIHIYIICPNNIYVCVKECKIVSEAEGNHTFQDDVVAEEKAFNQYDLRLFQ